MKNRRKKLKEKGWELGGIKEFLDLSKEEVKLIEVRIALGRYLREQREKKGYTQHQLAKMMKSSQSRIAKMEKGDNSVTIDAMFKFLFYLQAPTKEIVEVITKVA